MSDVDFLELAKLTQANIHSRRTMEWQLLLGYWGGLVLIVFAFLSGKVSPTPFLLVSTSVGLVLLLLVVVFFCIIPIQRAHAIDQDFFVYYTRRAEGRATDADIPDPNAPELHPRWTVGQIAFSVLLTAIAILLICSSRPTPACEHRVVRAATPNQSVERTATRRMSTLGVVTTSFELSTRALGRRRSPLSR
jgi:hypothetical protein